MLEPDRATLILSTTESGPAAAIGWVLSEHISPLLLATVTGAGAGIVCFGLLLAVLDRDRATAEMVSRTVRSAFGAA